LTLKRDEVLSSFAFNFNLRRYIVEMSGGGLFPVERRAMVQRQQQREQRHRHKQQHHQQ
jgi:hypothetical protein